MGTAQNPVRYLRSATNVDIGDTGVMTLRDELVEVSAVPTHSLYSSDGILYGVQNGQLCTLDTAFFATPLVPLTNNKRVSYAKAANGAVIYTNGTDIGYLQAGAAFDIPVPESTEEVTPTEEGIQTFKVPLPPGDFVESFNSSIYVAARDPDSDNCLIVYTDPYTLHCDETENFLYMRGYPTLLSATDDTLWFSNGIDLFAWVGTGDDERRELVVAGYAAVPGTAVVCEATDLGVEGISGKAVVVTTALGVCILSNGGQMVNLSRSVFAVPLASGGAGAIIQSRGYTRYVASLTDTSPPHNQFS